MGNGASIPVWDAAWLPGKKPYIIQSPKVQSINRVRDLIDEQTSLWKEATIKSTVNAFEADGILNIPLGANGLIDRFRWCAKKSDDYTVRNEYRLLLRGIPETDTDTYRNMMPQR